MLRALTGRELDGDLIDTPQRVAVAYEELLSGYDTDVGALFKSFDGDDYDQQIVMKNIEFVSLCEHHLLPFSGVAHVAYIPQGSVIGASKMARVVEAFARRLQLQEHMTKQVALSMQAHLMPKGAACVVRAKHSCMGCRGVKQKNAEMVTSYITGCYRTEPETRAELFKLIGEV